MDDDHIVVQSYSKRLGLYVKYTEELFRFKGDARQKVVILGYPYEEDSRLNFKRCGVETGPNKFRLHLNTIEIYPEQSQINKLLLLDNGNVGGVTKGEGKFKELHIEDVYQELQRMISEVWSLGSSIPLLIGGCNTLFYSAIQAFETSNVEGENACILNISPILGSREGSKSLVAWSHIGRAMSQLKYALPVIHFGVQGIRTSKREELAVRNLGHEIVWLSEIRRQRETADSVFRKVIDDASTKYSRFLALIDLEVVNSAFSPGVSDPSVIGGLTDIEITQIAASLATLKGLRLCAISEYNPAVEDKRTGHLMCQMYWAFVKELSNRS